MNQEIEHSINVGLEYLRNHQNLSGGFTGYADGKPTDTIFFSALISGCLESVDGSKDIRFKATQYLLANRRPDWSWNYWEVGSASRTYPNDLDDTACAVASIAGCDLSLITAPAQAAIARCLISCETKPGGPYKTWIGDKLGEKWDDVDIVVNTNIGYMLAKLGVQSTALEEYVTSCIRQSKLQSPYYIGTIPTFYFLSRWYRGEARNRVVELVREMLTRTDISTLELAMLLSALCNLGYRSEVDEQQVMALVDQQQDGCWPDCAVYYEPPVGGQWRYAGSPELTTAVALEALSALLKPVAQTPDVGMTSYSSDLHALYSLCIQQQTSPEVVDIAGIIARAGGWKIKESVIRNLNRGSRNGWLAYDIYDDILDNEGDPKYLGVATMAMRKSVTYFTKAQTGSEFALFVERVLRRVDAANTWEVHNARDTNNPPNYGLYAKLAQRSWGHVIAPTGVLLAAGYPLQGAEVTLLHSFFHHYLIARQLCDDAHDWLDDLRANRITPVVALVLRGCPDNGEIEQQVYFWEQTIDEVNTVMRTHLTRARSVLRRCTFLVHKTELNGWLSRLEQASRQAEQGRAEALQFIELFTTRSLIK